MQVPLATSIQELFYASFAIEVDGINLAAYCLLICGIDYHPVVLEHHRFHTAAAYTSRQELMRDESILLDKCQRHMQDAAVFLLGLRFKARDTGMQLQFYFPNWHRRWLIPNMN